MGLGAPDFSWFISRRAFDRACRLPTAACRGGDDCRYQGSYLRSCDPTAQKQLWDFPRPRVIALRKCDGANKEQIRLRDWYRLWSLRNSIVEGYENKAGRKSRFRFVSHNRTYIWTLPELIRDLKNHYPFGALPLTYFVLIEYREYSD